MGKVEARVEGVVGRGGQQALALVLADPWGLGGVWVFDLVHGQNEGV